MDLDSSGCLRIDSDVVGCLRFSSSTTTIVVSIFLEEAINSVINQTYKNWQLYIIDDGSRDNSIAISTNVSSASKAPELLH